MMDAITAFIGDAFTACVVMPGTNAGKRLPKKIRLSRPESRRRSLRGNREREAHNREVAMRYIKANPMRLAEWERRNRKAA